MVLWLLGCAWITEEELCARVGNAGVCGEPDAAAEECDAPLTLFPDADGDGYGTGDAVTACAPGEGLVEAGGDCDDGRGDIFPGAAEACDAVDMDCDGIPGNADIDQDGFRACEDCDDAREDVHPGAAERCDGIDNDCDTRVDAEVADAPTWYRDADQDTFGDAGATAVECDAPGGYVADASDCDDANADVHPGANEECTDAEDLNCDGSVGAVDDDGDGFAACEECDDAHASAYPGAPEVCDDLDNDCNGVVDTDAPDPPTWYEDLDGDGYGVDDAAVISCDMPVGYAPLGGDCDDGSTAYHPDAPEIDCEDPADYNCDGSSGYADTDGDGFPACAECDDSSAAVNPDATELCNDVDDDCDRTIDEDDAADAPTWYSDADADTYGNAALSDVACDAPAGYVGNATDCDDTRATDRPGATESCDGRDNDCDSTIDEPDAEDAGTWYADDDADTFGGPDVSQTACDQPAGYVSVGTDCDDADDSAWPGAPEYCDGADDDCDGTIDEDDALDVSTWYRDADSDRYGSTATSDIACDAPAGYVADRTDCDDTDNGVNPAAAEYCDGEDDDCDGSTDEGDAIDADLFFEDADADGFGDPDASTTSCSLPAGYVSDASDCDDTRSTVNPDADEVCDGLDNDCNGSVDPSTSTDAATWYRDSDGDTYGLASTTQLACTQPSGYASRSGDCNDGASAVSPAATETCDYVDNDCDGSTDESTAVGAPTWYADTDSDGYGNASVSTPSCGQPSGYVSSDEDCDDGDGTINPGAEEDCAATDRNCDGDATAGATDAPTWYEDGDGDGYGSDATMDACTEPAGYTSVDGDCDDVENTTYPTAVETQDLEDDDCDGWVDEDFFTGGEIVIAEVAHRPRVGSGSVTLNAHWLELYNPTADTIDLSNWYVFSSATSAGFYIPEGHTIAAGGYYVLCRTDNYETTTGGDIDYGLNCDHVYGENVTGSYGNTAFVLNNSSDTLGVYIEGTQTTGVLIDTVAYNSASGWPATATQTMSLDPAHLDASDNGSVANWCSTTTSSSAYVWWYSGASREYGTPGAANYDCP